MRDYVATQEDRIAFTEPEVAELCAQHTAATGRRFEPEGMTRGYGACSTPCWRALAQAAGYLDRTGLVEGWLVMFDLRAGRAWEERLTMRTVDVEGKRVHLVGC